MARAPRITPAGVVFHVTNHAAQGLILFRNEADFRQFYRLLVAGSRRFKVRVVAFCLMTNHWHLVLWPSCDGAVSAFLHWVTTQHSLRFRIQTDSVGRGHVYQDRFDSFPVQTGRYYLNAVRYVERNPRHARLVAKAEDWRWSSLFERLHGGDLLSEGPMALPADWVDRVNAPMTERDSEVIDRCERNGRPYGSPKWVTEIAVRQSLQSSLRGRGRPTSGRALRKMRLA